MNFKENCYSVSLFGTIAAGVIKSVLYARGEIQAQKATWYHNPDTHPGTNQQGHPTIALYKNGKRGSDGVFSNTEAGGKVKYPGAYKLKGNGDITSSLEPIFDPRVKYNFFADVIDTCSPLATKGFSYLLKKIKASQNTNSTRFNQTNTSSASSKMAQDIKIQQFLHKETEEKHDAAFTRQWLQDEYKHFELTTTVDSLATKKVCDELDLPPYQEKGLETMSAVNPNKLFLGVTGQQALEFEKEQPPYVLYLSQREDYTSEQESCHA